MDFVYFFIVSVSWHITLLWLCVWISLGLECVSTLCSFTVVRDYNKPFLKVFRAGQVSHHRISLNASFYMCPLTPARSNPHCTVHRANVWPFTDTTFGLAWSTHAIPRLFRVLPFLFNILFLSDFMYTFFNTESEMHASYFSERFLRIRLSLPFLCIFSRLRSFSFLLNKVLRTYSTSLNLYCGIFYIANLRFYFFTLFHILLLYFNYFIFLIIRFSV